LLFKGSDSIWATGNAGFVFFQKILKGSGALKNLFCLLPVVAASLLHIHQGRHSTFSLTDVLEGALDVF